MALLFGLVVVVALVVALVGFAVRDVVLLHRDESRRPADVMAARWHLLLGYGLLAAGTLWWVVLGALVEPLTRDVLAGVLAVHEELRSHELEAQRLAMFGREARWAAILLAVGGLVLLARAVRRRLAVTGVVVAWVVTDLVLDMADADARTVATAGAVLAGLAVLVTLGRRRAGPPGPLPVVYSAASVTAAFPLVMAAGPWSAQQLPPWVVPLVAVQAALLVVGGVAVSLAASPTPTPHRVRFAGVVAFVGALAAAGHAWWEFAAGDEEADGRAFLPGVAGVAVVVTACAVVCGGPVRGRRDRWAWAGICAALGVVTGVCVGIAFGVFTFAQFVVPVRIFVEGPLYLLPGILAGGLVGLAAVLPASRSYRSEVAVVQEAQEEPQVPRPVGTPGVPEILEWPPRPDEDPAAPAEPAEQVIDLGELTAETASH